MSEHEFEPVRGLPERLPEGERILWQGTPDWRSLAIRAFHVRKFAAYFAVLLVARGMAGLGSGETALQATTGVLWLLPFALAALALLAFVAWMMARAAVYTITNRRVTMRIGVVLEVTFNLPFRMIESASLRTHPDGTGDIPLILAGSDRIAYAHLWPHARPWRFGRPEPMLRCVPQAAAAAATLSQALAEYAGLPARAAAPAAPHIIAPAPQPHPLAAALHS
jgi:hypothetical protein